MTIAVSVVISGIVALDARHPALAALTPEAGRHARPRWPFASFNRGFDRVTRRYTAGVALFCCDARRVRPGGLRAVMPAVTGWCSSTRARRARAERGPGLRLPGDAPLPPAVARPTAHPRRWRTTASEARERRIPPVANVITFVGLRSYCPAPEDQLRHFVRDAQGLVASERIPQPGRAAISRLAFSAAQRQVQATAS